MTTKSEERIKKMLDDQIEKQVKAVNEQVGGVFLYGVVVGIVMSYSGFLGYFAGIGTGVLFSHKYKIISYQLTTQASYWFYKILGSHK